MVTFKVNTNKLKKAFKQLKFGLGRQNKRAKGFACEITVIDGLVIFNVPGLQNSIPCTTQGTVKVTTPFFRLNDIIQHETQRELLFEIGDETMKIGITTISVLTCVFKDDTILRSIHMPINFEDIDFLRLEKQGYTTEEIEFNKLRHLVVEAENNVDRNINAAYQRLKGYGVTYEELETLVQQKIDDI